MAISGIFYELKFGYPEMRQLWQQAWIQGGRHSAEGIALPYVRINGCLHQE